MNNTIVATSTVIQNEADQVLLDNWMGDVRAFHAKHATPMFDDDPRLAQLATFPGGGPNSGFTPEERGELYFTFCGPAGALPVWPLPAPAWAVEVRNLAGVYPELVVCFYGKTHGEGKFSARIESTITVFVDDFVNNAGEVSDHRGDIESDGPPRIGVYGNKDLITREAAAKQSVALMAAAAELLSFEAATI